MSTLTQSAPEQARGRGADWAAMPIANGQTPRQCRDGANFVRLGHCGAGRPELLSARFPPRPFEPCDALGRSQVVRQRILIPPSGGSNPPAPASAFKVNLIMDLGGVLGGVLGHGLGHMLGC